MQLISLASILNLQISTDSQACTPVPQEIPRVLGAICQNPGPNRFLFFYYTTTSCIFTATMPAPLDLRASSLLTAEAVVYKLQVSDLGSSATSCPSPPVHWALTSAVEDPDGPPLFAIPNICLDKDSGCKLGAKDLGQRISKATHV